MGKRRKMENSSSSEKGGGGAEDPAQQQLFCLRWNNFQNNLTTVFDQLLQNESFVDVTLACADGHSMKAHKIVLSACSPYFHTLFSQNPKKHPIVIFQTVKWTELKAVVDFMYKGEINVCHEQIPRLLQVAESLQVRGLADVKNDQDFTSEHTNPTAAMAPASCLEMNRSPNRVASSNGGGSAPARKRRRPSTDRGSSSTNTEETLSVINSPSRALELVTSPSSSLGNGTGGSGCGMAGATGGQSASGAQNSPHGGSRPSQSSTPQSPSNMTALPLPPPPVTLPSSSGVTDEMDIKPGIAELIREEERAKFLESSQAWLNASTSSLAYYEPPQLTLTTPSPGPIFSGDGSDNVARNVPPKPKAPTWTQAQLKEAKEAVVTQKMRFTQASVHYGIPKGTLYDNILGKQDRMKALEQVDLTEEQEKYVMEFCCEISVSPYNRRTHKTITEVAEYIRRIRPDVEFDFSGVSGFQWWWAFCKRHSITSLCCDSDSPSPKAGGGKMSAKKARRATRVVKSRRTNSASMTVQDTTLSLSQNNEPVDFSTRESSPPNQNTFNTRTDFNPLEEFLKLNARSPMVTPLISANGVNMFSKIPAIHSKTIPITNIY